jgi:hypothetical protein
MKLAVPRQQDQQQRAGPTPPRPASADREIALSDNRPEAVGIGTLAGGINSSQKQLALRRLAATINNSPRQLARRRMTEAVNNNRAPLVPSVTRVVQRYLSVKFPGDDKHSKMTDAEETFQKVEARLVQPEQKLLLEKWRAQREQVLVVLREWIEAPQANQKNTNKTLHAITRSYEDPADLATAVLARVGARDRIGIEERMAEKTLQSRYVLDKLKEFLSVNVPTSMSYEHLGLLLQEKGRYLEFMGDGQKKLEELISDPSRETVGLLLAAIHDITDILYEDKEYGGHELLTIPAAKLVGTTIKEGDAGTVTLERTPLSDRFRGTNATPNEKDPHIMAANRLGMPISMGPSRTTGRLLMFAEACRADKDTKEAIAWALFAFWYKEYRRDLTDIHRFHFTMDMAANFGVDYDPLVEPMLHGKSMLPKDRGTTQPAPKAPSLADQTQIDGETLTPLARAMLKKLEETRARIDVGDYRRANKVRPLLGLDDTVKLNAETFKAAREQLVKLGLLKNVTYKEKDKDVELPLVKLLEPADKLIASWHVKKDADAGPDQSDDEVDYASSDSEDEFDFESKVDLDTYAKRGYRDIPKVPVVPTVPQIADDLTGTYFGTEMTFTCPDMLISSPTAEPMAKDVDALLRSLAPTSDSQPKTDDAMPASTATGKKDTSARKPSPKDTKTYYRIRRLRQKGIVNQKQRLWATLLSQELERHNPFGATIKPKKKPGKSGNVIYRVKFTNIPKMKNTWWFDIDVDVPCIELSTRRMTVEQARILAPIIQHYIFDFAKSKVGLTPHEFEGGGHIHIDLMTGFQNNQYKLLNFMTEIHNLGVWPFLDLGFMKKVAPSLSAQPDIQPKYASLIARAKQNEFQGSSLSKIITELQQSVYGGAGDSKEVHNQLLGLRSYELRQEGLKERARRKQRKPPRDEDFLKVATLENRAHRAQTSHRDLLSVLHLYQQRLKVTSGEALTEPTPLALPMKDGFPVYPGDAEQQQTWAEIARRIAAYFDATPDVYLEDYLPSLTHLPEGFIGQIRDASTKKKPQTAVDTALDYDLPKGHNPPATKGDAKKDRLLRPIRPLHLMYHRDRRATTPQDGLHLGDVIHIYNSCYLASLLTMFANTEAYSQLFDPERHRIRPQKGMTQGQSIANLVDAFKGQWLQRKDIHRLITVLQDPKGLVTGEEVEGVLEALSTLRFLAPLAVLSDPVEDPQDAAEVLQQMLAVLQPPSEMTFEEQSQLKTNANPNFVGAADPTSGSILQLPIDQPGITSIDTALEHYCASERVTFGQDHAQKRTRFLRLPKVLTIALGRFKRFEGDSVKLTKMIFAPALLTVPRSCLHQAIAEHKYVYRLTSFIHHSGTFAGGHYVSYNKGPDGKVQRSDDIAGPDRPSPEQTKRDKDTAYMYVYQLVDPEQLDPLDVRENEEERAKAKSDQPAGNIDSHGLPLPDAIVVAKRTQKSRRELFRVLNKEELSTNVAKEPTDPDIEPHQTAVLDGQVFLTDQPKGTRFTQVIRVKIDDLVFESGNKWVDEFALPDESGERNVATREELSANTGAGWYARQCQIIQHTGHDRDRQRRMLTLLTTPEQRQILERKFEEDLSSRGPRRGRVADYLQRMVISLINEMDQT